MTVNAGRNPIRLKTKSRATANGTSVSRIRAGHSVVPSTMSNKFLPCLVFGGMFSDEWAVEIKIKEETLSLYAKKQDVQVLDQSANTGLLRVKIWDATDNIIALPAETLEQGRRFLVYPISELQSQ